MSFRFTIKFIRNATIIAGVSASVVPIILAREDDNDSSYNLPSSDKIDKKNRWDDNWDRRSPESLLENYENNLKKKKSIPIGDKDLDDFTPKYTRNIILIRHGNYHRKNKQDEERFLTPIGEQQAKITATRLKELNLNYDKFISSTMQRAIHTSQIISEIMNLNITKFDDNLREGYPCPAEPEQHNFPPSVYFEHGARIETAFRKYFHRSELDQTEETCDIIVCHANVIRYFICRAMQISPSAWKRFDLKHASITWIRVRPSGRISISSIGDVGHLPRHLITTNTSQL